MCCRSSTHSSWRHPNKRNAQRLGRVGSRGKFQSSVKFRFSSFPFALSPVIVVVVVCRLSWFVIGIPFRSQHVADGREQHGRWEWAGRPHGHRLLQESRPQYDVASATTSRDVNRRRHHQPAGAAQRSRRAASKLGYDRRHLHRRRHGPTHVQSGHQRQWHCPTTTASSFVPTTTAAHHAQ